MKTYKFLVLAIILSLTQIAPAYAGPLSQQDTIRAKISNRTGEQVDINLSGPGNLRVTVDPGTTTISLVPGRYSYTYRACEGKSFQGTFEARENGATLQLVKCAGGNGAVGRSGNPVIAIQNKTTGNVPITLSGPKTYSLTLAPGTVRLEVVSGKYNYSYTACGKTYQGSLNTKRSLNQLVIAKCTGTGGGGNNGGQTADDEESRTVTLFILNKTNEPLSFVFSGPTSYTIRANVGKTKVEIQPGTYRWILSTNACGGFAKDSGQIIVKTDTLWVWDCTKN